MDLGIFEIMGGIAAICIICWTASHIASITSRERTRRELFAYVAEKSITMEEAERLLERCDAYELRRSVLDTAAWDSDWDRWRDTVSNVVGAGPRNAPADKPDAQAKPSS